MSDTLESELDGSIAGGQYRYRERQALAEPTQGTWHRQSCGVVAWTFSCHQCHCCLRPENVVVHGAALCAVRCLSKHCGVGRHGSASPEPGTCSIVPCVDAAGNARRSMHEAASATRSSPAAIRPQLLPAIFKLIYRAEYPARIDPVRRPRHQATNTRPCMHAVR